MFTGFEEKYPEYEVITPQTKNSFTIRSLNVLEEEKLKGSLLTPTKVTEHLNKCIFECVVAKPEKVKDFKSFLQNTTLKDRDGLLYGLYHISYGEFRNYDIRCTSCRKDYSVTINASDTFNANMYPEDDILAKRVTIKLPLTKTVSAVLRQPTLDDEAESLKRLGGSLGYTVEVITETLIIESFSEDRTEQVEPIVYVDRADIIDAYRALPAKDKRVIYEKYVEEFGKYNIELKMKSFCTHCGNEEVVNIDLVENFFRMVYTS